MLFFHNCLLILQIISPSQPKLAFLAKPFNKVFTSFVLRGFEDAGQDYQQCAARFKVEKEVN